MATITNDGLVWAAKRSGGVDSVAPMTYLAVGTGTGAEAQGDTALGTEITDSGLARASVTPTYEADYKCVWSKLWTVTGTQAIREIGLFNAASGPTMFVRHLWASARNVESGDTFTATIKMTAARAA